MERKRQLDNIAIKKTAAINDNATERLTVAQQIQIVLASLEDAKAGDVVSIDIAARSTLADFMVVASGRSRRHVLSLADQCLRQLREVGIKPRIEGLEGGDWVLIDTGDIIIHLFCLEIREFYNLEKIWLHGE